MRAEGWATCLKATSAAAAFTAAAVTGRWAPAEELRRALTPPPVAERPSRVEAAAGWPALVKTFGAGTTAGEGVTAVVTGAEALGELDASEELGVLGAPAELLTCA